jgi:hypothetical protein
MRGFDGLALKTTGGWREGLIASDASVPYRTSVRVVSSYDGEAVAASIETDIERHGAPLVWRMDRASPHTTERVRHVLDRHEVLLLQGPPGCPRFYGQHERQNREHRGYLRWSPLLSPEQAEVECEGMLNVVNEKWRRPQLGWRTAGEMWGKREAINENRAELRADVEAKTARLMAASEGRGMSKSKAERLAIVQALQERGYVRLGRGRRC